MFDTQKTALIKKPAVDGPFSAVTRERLAVIRLVQAGEFDCDGRDLIEGLAQSPKCLPSRYSYDRTGSQLYAQITQQQGYYLTRTERSILETTAEELVAVTGPCDVIELGSGIAEKSPIVLSAYLNGFGALTFYPIEISEAALLHSSEQLVKRYPALNVVAILGDYIRGLRRLKGQRIRRSLVMFLGGSLSNMSETSERDLLHAIHASVDPGDFLLVGFDLRKPKSIIEEAYNLPNDLSSKFILNKLRHINHLFGGNFVTDNFHHRAHYDEKTGRAEAVIYSTTDQQISLMQLSFKCQLESGEPIIAEIMRKHDSDDRVALLEAAGFGVRQLWTDPRKWFALVLAERRAL